MGLLVRPGPNRWKSHLPELAFKSHVVGGPRQYQQLFGLVQLGLAQAGGSSKPHVLIGVVVGASARADDQPTLGQVVQQRRLMGHPHRIVERQFDDPKSQHDS